MTPVTTPKHSQNTFLALASRTIHEELVIQKTSNIANLGPLRVYLVCENKAIENQAKSML